MARIVVTASEEGSLVDGRGDNPVDIACERQLNRALDRQTGKAASVCSAGRAPVADALVNDRSRTAWADDRELSE